MSLNDTRSRLLLAGLGALALFLIAFVVARSVSSEAAPAPLREQPAESSGEVEHVPLRAIGRVPALPRAQSRPRPAAPPPPPPPAADPTAPVPPPSRPPPPPPGGCVGEIC
jgi:hypothetical protein